MTANMTFTPIIPRSMNISGYEKIIKQALKKETTEIEKQFKRVSGGFSTPKPQYSKVVEKKGGDLQGTTSTTDKRMVYLNYGTDKRFAVMSKDFRPMTSTNSLNRTPRRGKKVFVGNKDMGGIKARHFDKAVVKERTKPFNQSMRAAMKEAASQTF